MTIWKFPISPLNFNVLMPQGAEILSVGTQNDKPHIWAIVDPRLPKVRRVVYSAGTGTEALPEPHGRFIGTYFLDCGEVYHVFDLGED